MTASLPITITLQDDTGADLVVIPRDPTSGNRYSVQPGTGESEIRRRRDVATSPYVHGEVEVSSVREARTYTAVLRCYGTSWADAWTLRTALYDVAQRRLWRIEQDIDGVVSTWEVRAADFTANLAPELTINNQIDVTLTAPVARVL